MNKQITTLKTKAVRLFKEAKDTVSNLKRFIQAVSLLIVSGHAIWSAQTTEFEIQYADTALLFAGTLILLTGCVEFLNQLNNKG